LIDTAFLAFFGGLDLKAALLSPTIPRGELAHEHRQNDVVCATDRFPALEHIQAIVARHDGDRAVRTLSCAEQYRVMVFAQLTHRENLCDIEVCLSAQAAKLYHMGFRQPVRRSTLADANEARDWRLYAEFCPQADCSGQTGPKCQRRSTAVGRCASDRHFS
jgi:hypothetical protein